MHTTKKKQEVCRDDHGGQRGSFGSMEGKEETRGAIWMGMLKEGQKKTINGVKRNENEQSHIGLTR